MAFIVAHPVLQFCKLTSGKPKPGHTVLFQLPESHAHSGVELGLVLSIFKGIKAPKVFSGEASVNSIMAFSFTCLDSSSGVTCGSFGLRRMRLGGLPNFSFVLGFNSKLSKEV